MISDNLILRSASPLDQAYIHTTWRESYAKSQTRWHLQDYYFKIWPLLIEMIQRRAQITIATLIDDPDLILGFMVAEPKYKILHYLYTRGPTTQSEGLREAGIATALLESLNADLNSWSTTHETKISSLILEKRLKEGKSAPCFDPGKLFLPEERQ